VTLTFDLLTLKVDRFMTLRIRGAIFGDDALYKLTFIFTFILRRGPFMPIIIIIIFISP